MPTFEIRGSMGDVVFAPDDCVLEVPARVGMLMARDGRAKSRMLRGMRCREKNMLVELNQEIDE